LTIGQVSSAIRHQEISISQPQGYDILQITNRVYVNLLSDWCFIAVGKLSGGKIHESQRQRSQGVKEFALEFKSSDDRFVRSTGRRALIDPTIPSVYTSLVKRRARC
jgi:hypothetical protein